jgi:isopenicillin-N epimerase
MAAARESLAGFVGARASDLVYVPNATTGINILARSLPLESGDEVLATDHEYGAVDRTWRFICRRRGARYVRAPVPLPIRSPEEIVEAVWSRVTDRTRALFCSHVTSPTAMIFPVAELVGRARDAGIISIVDGAHAPGQIDLDLDALGADVYAANCHKWLMAPKGAGFLHVRPELHERIDPLVVSWGWEAETPGPSLLVDRHEWQGTRDVAAYLAVPEAIRFHRENDWARVGRDCHRLLQSACDRVARITGLEPVSPGGPAWFAQMAAVPLPPCDAESFQQRLLEEHRIEIPVIEWNSRQLLRISIQGYNTEADVDALEAALKNLLRSGA